MFSDNGFRKLKAQFNDLPLGIPGCELEEWNTILSTIEDWAFQLCPLNFNQFIEQAEKLCCTQIGRVRTRKFYFVFKFNFNLIKGKTS